LIHFTKSITYFIGQFGNVKKVREKLTGEIMVWKEINYKDIKKEQIRLIVSEVNILRSVDDENVVKYHARINDKHNFRIYILMEYCEKGDLKQLIQKHQKSKEPIDENVIWRLLTELTLALRA
jgi:serine/threonine protein kinase